MLFEPKFEGGRGFEEMKRWFPVDLLFSILIKKGEWRQRRHAEGERLDDWLYVGVAPFITESAPVPRQWGGGGHIKQHSVIHF